jgi:hypothetical protein
MSGADSPRSSAGVDAARGHDTRHDALAQHGVGHADDGDVGDLGVAGQHLLDVARVDVEAPR